MDLAEVWKLYQGSYVTTVVRGVRMIFVIIIIVLLHPNKKRRESGE